MTLDILPVLLFLAVDITRQVQVEFVLLDLLKRDHAREAEDVEPAREGIDNFVDVLGTEPVFRAVLHEALAGVDHEDAPARLRVFLVDDDDAGWDTGTIEQVRRQADDALDITLADKVAADFSFGVSAEQNTVRQDAGTL